MRSLTPEQWKDHIVYLTREKPKTNMNGVVGGYLAKITDAFDIEDVKNAWGGYEFSYIMKRKNEIAYHGRFTVEAPPKVDPSRESTAGSENGSAGGGNASAIVQQVFNMLREELERNRGANGVDHGTTEKAVEMLSKASDKAMDVILKQVPGRGEGGAGGDTGIIATIKVLKELGLIGQPAAATDPMKQVETMISIFKSLDEIRGGGGGGRRDWKATLAERALDAVPQVLDTFRQTREANVEIARERARASENLRHVANPSAPPVRTSVMTPRGTAPAPAAAPGHTIDPRVVSNGGLRTVPLDRVEASAEASAAVPAEIVFETIDRNSPAFDNFLKQTIVEMVLRGDHGEQIVDFLDGAKPGYSENLVRFSPEQLTGYFGADPILRAAVDHPSWFEVLDEARKYILEADEEGEEETPAPGAKGKPN